MRSISSRVFRRAAVAGLGVAVFVACLDVVSVRAQTTTPIATVDTVLQKLNTLLALVGPEPSHVVLTTGSVFVKKFDDVLCAVANVGSEPVLVLQRIVAADGTVSYGGNAGAVLVEPGKTGYASQSSSNTFYRCEFEFDGTASSVRGTLSMYGSEIGSTLLAIDAR